MSLQWFVVRTKPHSEHLAATELCRDGVEAFFPSILQPPMRSRRSEQPLFPGYLFLRCNPQAEGWPSFRPGQHTLGWVNFRGEVPSIPDDVIHALKQKCEVINQEGGIWKRFNPGDRVRIVSATIKSFAKVVEDGKTPGSPVTVMLQFLDRLVPTEVPRANLQPVATMAESRVHAPRRTRGGGRWIQGFGPRTLASG